MNRGFLFQVKLFYYKAYSYYFKERYYYINDNIVSNDIQYRFTEII